ncbi:MAG: TetR/AcrR family transcriptional regulator [Microbacterium sp.]
MTGTTEATDTRTRILDAAESLFAQHGFDGTSTARIARAAGVPKGLLFYYFPAKPDILAALIGERLGTGPLDPILIAVPGDPVQTLVNLGDRVLRERAASDVLREIVWHESHTRPEVSAALSRYRHALHDAVERALIASLPASIDLEAIRAAAVAWSAMITARPLEPPPSEEHGGRGHLHDAIGLRAIARLLIAGLQASLPKTATP